MAKKNEKFILREGFFRSSDDDSTYNLPVANQRAKVWKGKKIFLEALALIEARAETKSYKGWSTCRCCGEENGSQEFKFEKFGLRWVWPEGYYHYVEEHNIRPGLAFQEFIIASVAATAKTKLNR